MRIWFQLKHAHNENSMEFTNQSKEKGEEIKITTHLANIA